MIDEIEGVVLVVSDQQKALEFYTEKLGFEKKLDTDTAGFRWVVVGPKDSKTVLSLADPSSIKKWRQGAAEQDPAKSIGGPTGIWFYTKDIDTAYGELKSRGVQVTAPERQAWGGIMSTVYDQDMNSFGLVGDYKD